MEYVFLIIIIGIIFYFLSIYNRLIALKNQVTNAFAQIDVQLKRRYDLIPNMIEVAKGYMTHERETLDAVISARNKAQAVQKNGSIDDKIEADTQVTAVMTRFMALSESYPELKADTQMTAIMEELGSTENRIAASRQQYNDAATFYNTYQEQIPNSWVAGFGKHAEVKMLEVIEDAVERKAVKVSFK